MAPLPIIEKNIDIHGRYPSVVINCGDPLRNAAQWMYQEKLVTRCDEVNRVCMFGSVMRIVSELVFFCSEMRSDIYTLYVYRIADVRFTLMKRAC